jgi:hypothetical protein
MDAVKGIEGWVYSCSYHAGMGHGMRICAGNRSWTLTNLGFCDADGRRQQMGG